ncbi:hypothetical protein EVAR_28722_1 [Eumeta japonica]|uniref:Uncharacterized protein n=1 Tax=Eumeta variegata TaxID=151549 RepID=A0A4C1V5C3_EUMVA|nr:hypothetical protein EVAR_28722_1 [Eumeta japonica]
MLATVTPLDGDGPPSVSARVALSYSGFDCGIKKNRLPFYSFESKFKNFQLKSQAGQEAASTVDTGTDLNRMTKINAINSRTEIRIESKSGIEDQNRTLLRSRSYSELKVEARRESIGSERHWHQKLKGQNRKRNSNLDHDWIDTKIKEFIICPRERNRGAEAS